MGEQLEKSYLLQKKIRGAMMYPGIILCVMIGIAILMFAYVLPKLTATFKEFNTTLPLPTRIVIGASDFFAAHYLVILVLIAGVILGVIAFSRTVSGKKFFGKLVLRLPVIGNIAKEVNSARATRTLTSLLSSGVDVVASIKITANVVQNLHYREMLMDTSEKIQKGSTLQSLFAPRNDLYPAFVSEMIGVGEETGTLSKTLLEVASYYESEVDQKTKDMSTVIEPFLMVFIGVGVGFFAIAMISPIYSLSNNL